MQLLQRKPSNQVLKVWIPINYLPENRGYLYPKEEQLPLLEGSAAVTPKGKCILKDDSDTTTPGGDSDAVA